jgi:hypothetical protein
MDASRFVFLDETGTATNMTRRYGRSPRGQRVVDATPHGHWLTTTFVTGLREHGIVAPLVLDGPMRGEVFRAYVEQMLVPALSPGDVVVLDNLAAHKVAGVREAIRAVGASILYLPPFSIRRIAVKCFRAFGIAGIGCLSRVRASLRDRRLGLPSMGSEEWSGTIYSAS